MVLHVYTQRTIQADHQRGGVVTMRQVKAQRLWCGGESRFASMLDVEAQVDTAGALTFELQAFAAGSGSNATVAPDAALLKVCAI